MPQPTPPALPEGTKLQGIMLPNGKTFWSNSETGHTYGVGPLFQFGDLDLKTESGQAVAQERYAAFLTQGGITPNPQTRLLFFTTEISSVASEPKETTVGR